MNVIVSNKCQTLLSNLNIDVIKNINGVFSVEDIAVQFKNFFFNKMILDITALENYRDINTIQRLSVALDMNKVILLLDDSPEVNSAGFLSGLVSMGIYNFTKNVDAITFLMDNPNTYKDVASFQNLNVAPGEVNTNPKMSQNNRASFIGQRIIGVKNITEHAGATTLCYILKKHLEKLYKAKAVETEKKDFGFFSDNGCDSVTSFELENYLKRNNDQEVILIDLNNPDNEIYCTDIIYLIEPGIIQLNRLIRDDNRIFEKLKGKKIILNKSVLSPSDVSDFEKESGSKVFYNISPLDDKDDNQNIVIDFLLALGFTRFNDEEDDSGGFSLFH